MASPSLGASDWQWSIYWVCLLPGDSPEDILTGYSWLEAEDIQACLIYARKVIGQERFDFLTIESGN